MAIRAGVVGAAGYAGSELVRLLLGHPQFDLVAITSNADAGERLDSVYPAFTGVSDLVFLRHDDPIITTCDVVFLAVPHTAAMAVVPDLLASGVTVFDLSADYRLSSAQEYAAWYGTEHTSPELLATRAFGIPELFSEGLADAHAQHEAGKAVLVACAGCYPTATSLAAAPAVRMGLLREGTTVVVDAISGVTGAGKTPSARTHYCHGDENLEAYNVCKHRHTPEIEQILGLPGRVVFTPHLAPLRRGLLSTVTLSVDPQLAPTLSTESLVASYRAFYQGHPLVQVLDAGTMPQTSSVVGTDVCQVGLAFDARTNSLVAVGAIDNLCRGAAGQAIQCANIVLGFDEQEGLCASALPV